MSAVGWVFLSLSAVVVVVALRVSRRRDRRGRERPGGGDAGAYPMAGGESWSSDAPSSSDGDAGGCDAGGSD